MKYDLEQIYYVYALIDSNTKEIFYVGKGKGLRLEIHLKEYEKLKNLSNSEIKKKARNSKKIFKINKILKSGHNIIIQKLIENVNEREALDIEVAIIDLLGVDNLTNLTYGGDGVKMSPDSIKKMIKTKKKRYKKENHPMFGKHHSQKTKDKTSEDKKGNKNNLGNKYTPDQKQNVSIGHIIYYSTSKGKESIKKGVETLRKTLQTEDGKKAKLESNKKVSIGLLEHYASPAGEITKQKLSVSNSGKKRSEETKLRQRNSALIRCLEMQRRRWIAEKWGDKFPELIIPKIIRKPMNQASIEKGRITRRKHYEEYDSPLKGIPLSIEHRQKLSKAKAGKPPHNKGKKLIDGKLIPVEQLKQM